MTFRGSDPKFLETVGRAGMTKAECLECAQVKKHFDYGVISTWKAHHKCPTTKPTNRGWHEAALQQIEELDQFKADLKAGRI